MVVARLGILRTGKFHLRLDPSFPPSRNVSVVQDRAAAVIITDRSISATVADLFCNGYRTVLMEDADSTARDDNPGIPITGDYYA